jgi:hypothetical protein
MIFPAINSNGIRAHYPNEVSFEHLTNATDLASGKRYSASWRNAPLSRFTLNFAGLIDNEVSVLRGFMANCHGRYATFQYVDPTGNLLQYSEDFTQAPWVKACTVVSAGLLDPFGGTTGSTLAGDGSGNSSISQVVFIDPGVAGSISCFSVYLQGIGSGMTIPVSATNGVDTVSKLVTIVPGVWKKVFLQLTFGTSGSITVGIGGSYAWTGTSYIGIFGPMFSLTKGDAPYLRTPEFYAVHPICRFDQDALDIQYQGPNQTDVTVKIAELSTTAPPGPYLLISMPGFGKVLYIGLGTPPTGWSDVAFDDSAWPSTVLGSSFHFDFFENGASYISDTAANHNPSDSLLYRFVITGAAPGTLLTLRAAADDFIQEVWFNGVQVCAGPVGNDVYVTIIPLGLSTGNDVMAVWVGNGLYAISLLFSVVG